MNANRITLIASVLAALAGNALAQTVPAEAWVGPNVPTTASALSREQVAQELIASQTEPQAAAEAWVGAAAAAGSPATTASREAVMADFDLYRREGLAEVNSDYFNPYGSDGQRRLQSYANLRSAPEFTPDKFDVQAATTTHAARQ